MIDIQNLELSAERLVSKNLKLFFKFKNTNEYAKVLELINIEGYIKKPVTTNYFIAINPEVGSYGHDISLRVRNPKILESYKQVYIFSDKACVHPSFTGVAEEIVFRDYMDADVK